MDDRTNAMQSTPIPWIAILLYLAPIHQEQSRASSKTGAKIARHTYPQVPTENHYEQPTSEFSIGEEDDSALS